MKKTLLFSIFAAVICSVASYSQTKVWDFGNDTATWPLSAGIGSVPTVVDNLGLFPIPTNTNFGAVTANVFTFSDGFTTVNRFQPNGGGSPAAGTFLPVQRYLFFSVSGACTVKLWARTGGSGTRNVFITNGVSLLATAGGTTSGEEIILTANVTAAQAAAGNIYIYSDQANNYYKLQVSGATVNTTLNASDFESKLAANVFSNGKNVFVSNVQSQTDINVYNLTGQLVKSFSTSSDTDFQLNQGLYIVNLISADGARKAVKVILQ